MQPQKGRVCIKISYLLILHQCFEYDINLTSKDLTSNKRKPMHKVNDSINHKIYPTSSPSGLKASPLPEGKKKKNPSMHTAISDGIETYLKVRFLSASSGASSTI